VGEGENPSPQSASRVSVVHIWRAVIPSGAMPSVRVAVLVTLGLVLGLTSGAMADSPEKNKALAKQHFEAGVSHFDLAEWEQALVEFKEAYRLKSDPSFLYNIAQCHRKLGHVDEALTFYKTYRRRAPDAPNREEIERRILELEVEQQAKQSRKTSEEQEAKAAADAKAAAEAKAAADVKAAAEARAAAEAKPASLPAPRVETPSEPQPVPSPLPTPVAGLANPAAVSPASENRADLVQPAGSTQPEATAETSILHRWWFWTAVGVVVVGGVTAALLATRGSGNSPFCSDCASTWGVDAK